MPYACPLIFKDVSGAACFDFQSHKQTFSTVLKISVSISRVWDKQNMFRDYFYFAVALWEKYLKFDIDVAAIFFFLFPTGYRKTNPFI